MVLMIRLVDGQGKYGVIIFYERRMEMKEEEASEMEEGLEEPKDVDV
ncbi:10207_t:CDS:1, partial [Paraglomus occultum]